MVRTPSPVVPLHIDVSRVLGWSTAIAVHVLALMLLLIPATQSLIRVPRERPEVRWLLPSPPLPPVPPVVQELEVKPQTPRTTPALPVPLPTPTAMIDDALAMDPLPASETSTPTLEPAPPATSAPLQGVQLQYRSAPPPPYPIQAIRQNQQGTVVLRIRVDVDGAPLSASIEKSSGSRLLD